MKTKTLLIIVAILIVILIGWAVLGKKNAAPQTPVTQATPSVDATPVATSTKSSTSSLPVIKLKGGSNGTTTSLVVGQSMIVTVNDPTDAGYKINPLQYSTAILSLTNHTHDASDGVNGTDVWEFTAIKSGVTGITITATQGTSKTPLPLFSNAVSVK